MIKEYNLDLLHEAVIAEQIPMDLAKAYDRSTEINSPIHSRSNVNSYYSNRNNRAQRRRTINIDYKNSNYEVISADECLNFLGLKLSPTGRALRQFKGEEFNNRIRQIRYLIQGNVVEFESNRSMKDNLSVISSSDSITFSREDFESLNLGVSEFSKTGRSISDSGYYNYSDIIIVTKLADKIYKTDEYDHLINRDSDLYNKRVDNDKRLRTYQITDVKKEDDIDYRPHDLAHNLYYDSSSYNLSNIPDTGSHFENTNDYTFPDRVISDFNYFMGLKKKLLARIIEYKGYIKKLNNWHSLNKISDEKYDEEMKRISEKLQKEEHTYKTVINSIIKFKSKVTRDMDVRYGEMWNLFNSTAKRITDFENQLHDLTGKLQNMDMTSTSEFIQTKSLDTNIKELKDNLNKVISDFKTLQSNKEAHSDEEVLNKVRESEDLINQYNNQVKEVQDKYESELLELVNKVEKLEDDARNREMILNRSKANIPYKDKAEFEKNYKEIRKSQGDARFAELDPQLKNIVNFISDSTEQTA